MAGQSGSSPNDMNMGDLAAALAAAESSTGDSSFGGQAHQGPQGGGSSSRGSGQSAQSLDFILDIPLKVTVELGRAKMSIREILHLAQGSVVELTKFAGDPLEVLVNDKLIARGEVVVINEKFGIRLTDIISPVERIEQLK